jgi:hypothetical protein
LVLPVQVLFGQSYTTLANDGTVREYTSITLEQFNRIRTANEQSAVSVLVTFVDAYRLLTIKLLKVPDQDFLAKVTGL